VLCPADLALPVVQAPLGGGPSTPQLTAAVIDAGGLGFLAAGYRTPEAVREDVAALRARTSGPFAVNVFAGPGRAGDPDAVAAYARRLGPEAARHGAALGEPRHDDDGFAAKLAVVEAEHVPVVSFTFGCPPADALARLRAADIAAWVTVTTPAEARAAAAAGASALVVQGAEAGGHRGSYDDAAPGDIGLLALLQLVAAEVDLPLIATGGIATGRGLAAVLAAGAQAGAIGTALMRTPEAGTAAAHRDALAGDGPTALTRAFTGRTARGIVNRFMREHDAAAPSAYPEVHNLTAPVRAAARAAGDADGFHLWAGQTHALATEEPAGDLVRRLAREAREALADAARRAGAD
jgi:nitronate monooxygenase